MNEVNIRTSKNFMQSPRYCSYCGNHLSNCQCEQEHVTLEFSIPSHLRNILNMFPKIQIVSSRNDANDDTEEWSLRTEQTRKIEKS